MLTEEKRKEYVMGLLHKNMLYALNLLEIYETIRAFTTEDVDKRLLYLYSSVKKEVAHLYHHLENYMPLEDFPKEYKKFMLEDENYKYYIGGNKNKEECILGEINLIKIFSEA